ncbi:MAG: methyltransferase domain-containing protein [Cyclobacteriaceae bacterium]|jgi:SAM-dependent methyltransferase|nr:methyltransferase domain-containing protein [Cyclobacteriaceae bacterium]
MHELNKGYNQWHGNHEHEDDHATPWHSFVRANLSGNDVLNKMILEIGCGRGGFSNYLINHKDQPSMIHACDYSETALKIGAEKYQSPKIVWSRQDIMSMTFESNSIDTAISCETIEHVPNPSRAIQELYRVLKPGGRLYLTCPNYFNFFGVWCVYRWLIGKPYTEGGQPYVNYILMPKVYHWIRQAGFIVEKFHSSELIMPARIPKHFYKHNTPRLLRPFGYRTYYVVRK